MNLTGINSYTSWMVALACCTINCLNLSAYRLAGLIYVEIVNQYGTDREKAAIPIILFILIFCLGGPVIGLLGQKYGLEEITLIGCFLAAAGFGGCFFAEDISTVIIFLGVVYGIGITFGNTFLPNILKKYFTKNLNSATGIYSAGSCIGAFVFPPIAIYLLDEYGVSGTFLIVSGIILNGIPVSMLVIMARSTIPTAQPKILLDETSESKTKMEIKLSLVSETLNDDVSQFIANNEDNYFAKKVTYCNVDSMPNEELMIQNKMNLQNLIIKTSMRNKDTNKEYDKNKQISCGTQCLSYNREMLHNEQQDAFKSGNIESHNHHNDLQQESQQCPIKMKINSSPKVSNPTKNCSELLNRPPGAINKKIKENELLNSLRIFLEPTFFIIMVIQSMHTYIITLVWTTLIDYSRDKGIDKSKELYILMFIPLADLIGRLSLGWVTDKSYLTLSKFNAILFVFMAMFTIIIVLSKSFTVLMVGGLLFASTSGALFPVLPALVFEFMDQDQHIMGLASRSVCYAPMSFTSAPLIGYFRGNSGSYDGLYYIFAGMCLMCSCITPFMPVFSKSMKKRRENSKPTHYI